uniref:Uncharacterized protein n=1 Tax=Ciona savignyi TaxID=51511 RepID=H2ZH71_CIOSA
ELYFPRKRKELSSVDQYSQQVTSPHTSLSETPTTSRYEYDAYSFQSTSQVDNNVVQSSTNFSHIHAAAGDPCRVEGAAAYPRTGDATAEAPIQGAIRKRKNFFPIKQHQTSTARQPHMSGDSTPTRRLSYETSFTSSPAVGIPLGRKQSSPANVYSSSMDSNISRLVHPSRTDPSRLSAHFITNPTQKNLNRRSYPSIVPPGSPLCVSSWEGGINRAGRKSIQQTDL